MMNSAAAVMVRESRAYEAAVHSRTYYWLHSATDSVALRLARLRRSRRHDAPAHVLLGPTGGGNIGDQAMFEAYLQHVDGPVVLFAAGPDALVVPETEWHRVTIRSSLGFDYAPPVARLPYSVGMAIAVSSARSFSVIGADLMDGSYNPATSLARLSALWMAAKCGTPSILLGCSWAETATPTCVAALLRANSAGSELNLRDEVSLQRVVSLGVSAARLTADVAFSLTSMAEIPDAESFAAAAKARGRRVALVNASGLVGQRMSQTAEYVTIVQELKRHGFAVILLPHVIRSTDDDLSECSGVFQAVGSEDVFLVRATLRPGAVRSLCAEADLVVTGRMHLAVLALSQGVLAITLGTHGKVEGMYRHFGALDYAIEPIPGFGLQIAGLIESAINQDPGWREYLPRVRDLAARNFSSIAPRVTS